MVESVVATVPLRKSAAENNPGCGLLVLEPVESSAPGEGENGLFVEARSLIEGSDFAGLLDGVKIPLLRRWRALGERQDVLDREAVLIRQAWERVGLAFDALDRSGCRLKRVIDGIDAQVLAYRKRCDGAVDDKWCSDEYERLLPLVAERDAEGRRFLEEVENYNRGSLAPTRKWNDEWVERVLAWEVEIRSLTADIQAALSKQSPNTVDIHVQRLGERGKNSRLVERVVNNVTREMAEAMLLEVRDETVQRLGRKSKGIDAALVAAGRFLSGLTEPSPDAWNTMDPYVFGDQHQFRLDIEIRGAYPRRHD